MQGCSSSRRPNGASPPPVVQGALQAGLQPSPACTHLGVRPVLGAQGGISGQTGGHGRPVARLGGRALAVAAGLVGHDGGGGGRRGEAISRVHAGGRAARQLRKRGVLQRGGAAGNRERGGGRVASSAAAAPGMPRRSASLHLQITCRSVRASSFSCSPASLKACSTNSRTAACGGEGRRRRRGAPRCQSRGAAAAGACRHPCSC